MSRVYKIINCVDSANGIAFGGGGGGGGGGSYEPSTSYAGSKKGQMGRSERKNGGKESKKKDYSDEALCGVLASVTAGAVRFGTAGVVVSVAAAGLTAIACTKVKDN